LAYAKVYKEIDEDTFFDDSNPFLPPTNMDEFNKLAAACIIFDWCLEFSMWTNSYGGSLKPLLGNMANCTDKTGKPHHHGDRLENIFNVFYPKYTISSSWESHCPPTPTSEYDTDTCDEEMEESSEEEEQDTNN
jgi:hypothetical protein